ncbi:MAG: hypothetical protein R2789_08395 [Microthrixaceae bacterium]
MGGALRRVVTRDGLHAFESGGLVLIICRTRTPQRQSARSGALPRVPHPGPGVGRSGISFPELANRIAGELGWLVLTMNFRGCGKAEGQFSLQGWLDDVAAAVAHVDELGAAGVWLAGYGTGGSLAVVEGAQPGGARGGGHGHTLGLRRLGKAPAQAAAARPPGAGHQGSGLPVEDFPVGGATAVGPSSRRCRRVGSAPAAPLMLETGQA